jgi:phosphatidylglycerophosphate synthase
MASNLPLFKQGRKVSRTLDNPIDNILYDFAYKVNPHLYKLGFTANVITMFAFITGMTACWFAYNSHFLLAALFITISHVFDCMDGSFARMFDQITTLGDLLDHASDTIKFTTLILIITFHKAIPLQLRVTFACVSLVFIAGSMVYFGCQEQLYEKTTFDTLSPFEKLCFSPHTTVQTVKHMGPGSLVFMIVFMLCIIWVTK